MYLSFFPVHCVWGEYHTVSNSLTDKREYNENHRLQLQRSIFSDLKHILRENQFKVAKQPQRVNAIFCKIRHSVIEESIVEKVFFFFGQKSSVLCGQKN